MHPVLPDPGSVFQEIESYICRILADRGRRTSDLWMCAVPLFEGRSRMCGCLCIVDILSWR